jgi:thiol-disulfide isomerase/thioredoxin
MYLSKSTPLFLVTFWISAFLLVDPSLGGDHSIRVTDDNWDQILTGEWMVEFFAPWCPACRNLQATWEEFASWSADLGVNIGQVDVTLSPGLGGRFMISALPTIYHVKDGIFRQYRGSRTKEEFLSFVEEEKWKKLDPISSWQAPDSIQMSVLSQFYMLSMKLRNVMNLMTEEYGLPVWSTYLIFGGLTVLTGLFLGLILVCLIDFVYPPSKIKAPLPPVPVSSSFDKQSDESGSGSDSEAEDESLYEDTPEKKSPKAKPTEARGDKPAAAAPRKRRPAKLD